MVQVSLWSAEHLCHSIIPLRPSTTPHPSNLLAHSYYIIAVFVGLIVLKWKWLAEVNGNILYLCPRPSSCLGSQTSAYRLTLQRSVSIHAIFTFPARHNYTVASNSPVIATESCDRLQLSNRRHDTRIAAFSSGFWVSGIRTDPNCAFQARVIRYRDEKYS
jgi:hypothetical protein